LAKHFPYIGPVAIVSNHGGHSARVNMQLLLNGSAIRIEQMGRDFLIINKPFDHPPADASLVLRVDDNETCWTVRLPHGISASSTRIAIGNAL
jgi:hypothetical protein